MKYSFPRQFPGVPVSGGAAGCLEMTPSPQPLMGGGGGGGGGGGYVRIRAADHQNQGVFLFFCIIRVLRLT